MSGKNYFNESTPKIVIQSLFRKYDSDGNGVLQRQEMLSLLMDDMALEAKKAENVLAEVDKDGDGNVNFEEFFQWLRDSKSLDKINESEASANRYYYTRKAVELFKKYDKDESGTIDVDELKQLLSDLNYKHSAETALKTMDIDGDGTVSFVEFLKWLNWIPADDAEWDQSYL